jgi:copper oxidase (laccase) domain-containing protein
LENIEIFPPLDAVAGVSALFIGRFPNIDVAVEREEAMERLRPLQQARLAQEGLADFPFVTAEQIHGAEVARVTQPSSFPVPGVDGLVTTTRGITLGISVADCAPVWLVTRDGSAGALLHSGKKGTELGIVSAGIRALCSEGNYHPSDLIMVIGPCILPPCYDVDFASDIHRQGTTAGVLEIHDQGICTACHPERYYSYRREKGLTGRMLATLTLLP